MKDNVIPAGSKPFDQGDTSQAEEETTPEQEAAPEVQPETPEPEKTAEPEKEEPKKEEPAKDEPDWQQRYEEAKKLIDRQGNELGTLRKQTEALSGAIDEMKASNKGEENDFNAQLQQVQEAVDSGELGMGEALVQVAQIGSQMGAEASTKQYRELRQKEQVQQHQQQFESDHPDFRQLVNTGALDDLLQDPMHDEVSAYFAFKSQEAQRAAEEAKKAEFERGKSEGAKLAKGDEGTKKVLGRPGATARETSPKPLKGEALHKAMLEAMEGTGQ